MPVLLYGSLMCVESRKERKSVPWISNNTYFFSIYIFYIFAFQLSTKYEKSERIVRFTM